MTESSYATACGEIPIRSGEDGKRINSLLDFPFDPDSDKEWQLEIAKREREIEEGKVKLIPWIKIKIN